MNTTILEQLQSEKLLPLYTATDLSVLDIAEKVLLDNGLHFIEVTYRSDIASQAIKRLSNSENLIVGAGTVCNLETAKDAIVNGAKFIVMPGLDIEVVKYCQNLDIPVFPGCVTPTEIIQAKNLGLSVVKFFPANIYGGLSAIKALSGPFPDIKFIPTGGVNTGNCSEFLNSPSILAVGGSFIISEKELIADNGVSVSNNLKKIISNITD